MERSGFLAEGAALATLAAGPTFVVSLFLAYHYLLLPKVVIVSEAELSLAGPILAMSVIVGGIVSAVPIAASTLLMSALANRLPPLRPFFVWIATGAALPLLACHAMAQSPPAAMIFALGFTGASTAALCRRSVRWQAEVPQGTATAPSRTAFPTTSPAHVPLTSLRQER